MATAYLIDNTAGTNSFAILPGSLNGPGGAVSDTDLRLFGLGAYSWGEGVNENFYRLTENFACPESVLTPGQPMDAAEIGLPGHGINDPIQGQLWFNTTSFNMSVFDGTQWKLVGGTYVNSTAPASPSDGDLWYDTVNGQLMIWNGTAWESVADRYVLKSGDTLTGFLTLNADPTSPLHAATKQYVDLKVNKSGDTLTGFLTLNANPTSPLHAATKQYVDTAVSSALDQAEADVRYVNVTGDTMTGKLTISGVAHGLEITNSAGAYMTLASTNASSTAPVLVLHNEYNNNNGGGTHGWTKLSNRDGSILVIERDTVGTNSDGGSNDNVVDITQLGELVFYGIGNVAGSGNIRLPNVAISDITNTKHVATKEYVDNAVSAGGAGVVFAQANNATSINLTLPAGTWVVRGEYRLHQASFTARALYVDGTLVHNSVASGDPEGTSYINLWGMKNNVSGSRTITVNVTGSGGEYGSSDLRRISAMAWKIG